MTTAERLLFFSFLILTVSFLLFKTAQGALSTIRVADSLERPLFVTAPAGDPRLFIVEQEGYIKLLKDGFVLPQPFLNIDNLVINIGSGFDERGFFGLAFHPQYASNGKFYVNYINNSGNTVIGEHYVSANPDLAIPDSGRVVIEITQPFGNHNGGHIAFGPNDGYLYIGMGDGGSGGDPFGNAQSLQSLLGKMLRIDVGPSVGYGVPPNNPYVPDGNALDEIWASGLRNPYRWSFDRLTGDMYIGDVGQSCWEEVDFQPSSSTGKENYGWDIEEGDHCFNSSNFNDCDNASCGVDLVDPIHEYSHFDFCNSINGGYVYRGSAIPGLQGTYFFADFCTGSIWSFRYDGANLTEFTDRTAELDPPPGSQSIDAVAGFGENYLGELFIVDRGTGLSDGEVYRIVDDSTVEVENPPHTIFGIHLTLAVPNPFTATTRVDATLSRPGLLRVEVADASGRLVRLLFSGERDAGIQTLQWDGRDDAGRLVAPGVYFLQATLAGESATRRVHLVR